MFEVGKRIRELREEKGITVNKLANLAGVSQSYLRDIELGNKQPTVEYLEYICYALGIQLAAFFDNGEKNGEFEKLLSRLSDDQKEKLLEMIKVFIK